MTANRLYTLLLAGVCGIIIAEAYKAGVSDGNIHLTVKSEDLPADDKTVTESSPKSDTEEEG